MRGSWRASRRPPLALFDALLRLRILLDAIAAKLGERRDRKLGIGEHARGAFGEFLIAHRPTRNLDIGKTDIDPLAIRGIVRFQRAVDAIVVMGRAFPIAAIERDDEIGFLEDVLVQPHVERMLGREVQPRHDIEDGRADRIGKRDHVAHAALDASDILRQQHRPFGGDELVGDVGERRHIGRDLARHLRRLGIGELHRFGQLGFLKRRRRSTCRSGLAARSS